MAAHRVLEPSFINGLYISQEMITAAGPDGYIVDIEPDVNKGGMIAGENLELVDQADQKKVDDANRESLRQKAKNDGVTKAGETEVDKADTGQLRKSIQDKAINEKI